MDSPRFENQKYCEVHINKIEAEVKKLKEQQLTEGEIAKVIAKELPANYDGTDPGNWHILVSVAKAIIKAREEKQTRTCDPDCPFCKTEEASK